MDDSNLQRIKESINIFFKIFNQLFSILWVVVVLIIIWNFSYENPPNNYILFIIMVCGISIICDKIKDK